MPWALGDAQCSCLSLDLLAVMEAQMLTRRQTILVGRQLQALPRGEELAGHL